VMGWRKVDAIKMLLNKYRPDLANEETIEQIHSRFIQTMVEYYQQSKDLQPLPFAEKLFEQLQANGIKVALNTGFTREIADTILQRLNWQPGGKIDAIVASDEVPEGRPASFMIEKIMRQFSISNPASVAKVGDTEVDVLEGRNAHCGLVIGVTTGAYTREQLESYKPDHIIDNLSELSSLIS